MWGRKELTLAQLSRQLDVDPSVVRRWQYLIERDGETAVAANGDVVPAYKLREAEQRIRQLERALGRKTMEVKILQAPREEVTTEADIAKWNSLRPAKVDYTQMRELSDETELKETVACAGGACEIVR